MSAQISYQDWSDFLLRIGAICTPSELHGLLCGLACCNLPTADDRWYGGVRDFLDLLDDETTTRAALEAQQELIAAALADDHYRLQLLLPDDALPLADRVEALALWCQGFLHGLGLVADSNDRALSEDAREGLQDLAQIAQMTAGAADEQEGEQDLMELAEYVRMTLFSIASQWRPATPPPTVATH